MVQPTNSAPLTLEALRAAATCMAEFSDTNRLSLDSTLVRLSLLNAPTAATLGSGQGEDSGGSGPGRALEWSGDGQVEWSSLIVRETAYGYDDEAMIPGST